MEIFSFGETREGINFKVLNERAVRASSGIMMLLGAYAAINAFILENYIVVPWITGFLALNFLIAITINPNFAPTYLLGKLVTFKQSELPIGAIQKRFAWTLGFLLATTIFILSFFLLNDVSYFEPVCFLCIICLTLLFSESAFGICVGCHIYFALVDWKFIPAPKENPNCMGDACDPE